MNYSLALSGGSALGYAHIGVFKYLEEKKLFPSEVSGTSMGSLISALIATGYNSDKMLELAESFKNPLSLYSLFNFETSFKSGNLIGNQKIIKILQDFFGDKKIGEADIPLYIIATDFNTGFSYTFSKDTLISDAVMASMSIPSIFPPLEINGNVYVDGYLSQNLPILKAHPSLPLLAVDVVSINSLNTLKEVNNPLRRIPSLINSIERNFRIFIINQTREILKRRNVSTLIEPDLREYKTFDFMKYKEIVDIGYKTVNSMDLKF